MVSQKLSEDKIALLLEAAQDGNQEAAAVLVRTFRPLVLSLVNKYSRRTSEKEDIIQVAMMGLTKAIQKFDLSTDKKFISYAVPTVVGEIKRYFRDCTWDVHVPRRVKEFYMHVNKAKNVLEEQLERSPRVDEIAVHLQVKEEVVLETMELMGGYNALSLETPLEGDGSERAATYYDYEGVKDDNYARVENRLALNKALMDLTPQEREIVDLLFFKEQTQTEVAEAFGVSQMHISRLRRKVLVKLKKIILDERQQAETTAYQREA